MKKILLTLMLMAYSMFSVAVLHAKTNVPQFKDYPVKPYIGKTAQLDMTDESARMFRTRLRDALKEQPNFAGEYVITMWGCGASCRSYAFINKRTGKLLAGGFGGEESQEDVIDSRANSRLLVTQEENMNENWEVESVTTRFYLFENEKFKLLKSVKANMKK
ncbi:hypothetical protein EXE10_15980 [Acinetobacter sp. WCHAc060033]|uniref:hypothetical protein n=1 Tax=Acinetobacter TaxID=469 RepID=UPI001023D5CC|nr:MULTISPECIES: hypothetical protein [Acinetobacter]RZG70709.1 hypothetical protein EXU29_16085 [Acinetobacter wuhouensis]RZG79229.1 hypothetical protein EXE10_15980 [Acinetobacter sp. WCHAc060033]